MKVRELIALLKKEKQDAEVFLREPYDDAQEYNLNNVLRRKADGNPKQWEIVLTP